MENLVVEMKALVKIYKGDKRKKGINTLKGINLKIKLGEKFAFLGPNGAGKS